MLSRSAQGLYWMGRYLERAQHLCRLLQLQTEALVDRPVREIYFGWRRIYTSMGLQPPGGRLVLDHDDDFTLADSYTLADDLTFERSNPGSVWCCLALGRENARQMRHCISAEMWTSLNLAYLRIQNLGIQDIWTSPESFYAETAAEIDTFSGVALTTMYRDDRWSFMQLGRFIERALLSATLLLAHLSAGTTNKEDSDDDWTSLLRAYDAFEAYSRRYSVEVLPDRVLDLLVTDPMIPSSLSRSIDEATSQLARLDPGPDANSSAATQRLTGRLGVLIHDDWADREDHEEFLRRINEQSRELHSLVAATYFDYRIEEVPAR